MSRYQTPFTVPPFAKSAFPKGSLFLAYRWLGNGFGEGLVFGDDGEPTFTFFNCSEPTGRDLNAISCSPKEFATIYQSRLTALGAVWIGELVRRYLQNSDLSLRKVLTETFSQTFGHPPLEIT